MGLVAYAVAFVIGLFFAVLAVLGVGLIGFMMGSIFN